MSMHQIEHLLRPCPLASAYPNQAPQWIYYFMYDQHYCWESFQVFFPSAIPLGIAWLRDWTWHINNQGKENIRRTFYNGKEASQDIITKGTYGFVFRITKDDDEKLHAVYGLDRVRIAQYVQIKTPGSPNGISALPVMIYWDPRNTRDGSIKDKFYGSMNEQHKWSQGFMRLKAAGVPHWYIERILEILMGLKIDKDPIYVDPKDLLYTLPTTPTLPQQQNSQDQSQGQTMIGRAERAISARIELTPSRAQSNGQPKSTARPQSTSGPRPAARPQPAATPKLHPASTGPNIKVAKKRQSDFGDEEAQPAKRKKLPPGPSNLSRSTLA